MQPVHKLPTWSWWLIIPSALLSLGIVAAVGVGTIALLAAPAPAHRQAPAVASAPAPHHAAPHTPTTKPGDLMSVPDQRDGQFTFSVHRITCAHQFLSAKSSGDPELDAAADKSLGGPLPPADLGRWCSVELRATNDGSEPRMFDASWQTLHDTQGRKYAVDQDALNKLPGNDDAFLNQLNPGASVLVTLPFDVPDDAVPATIELHDSPLSGGVRMPLHA